MNDCVVAYRVLLRVIAKMNDVCTGDSLEAKMIVCHELAQIHAEYFALLEPNG